MKRKLIFITTAVAVCLQFGVLESRAQSDDLPKIEVAAEFTSITKPSYGNGSTEPGFGGRFTFNLNRSVAVETAGYFFPHKCFNCSIDNGGNIVEGLFGVKAGKRFEKWGIFAKGRPGFVSFSQGHSSYFQTGPIIAGSFPFEFRQERATHLAFDAGGVLEFYPSKRIVTRFDAGDTLIHYGANTVSYPSFDFNNQVFSLVPYRQKAETRHNFQFAASVGFRF